VNPLEKYRKIIVTNHVIEVYEYEKMPYGSEAQKNDAYDALNLEDVKHNRDDDRAGERRKQTVRDARNTTRRLALKNFESGDKFLTLTFDPKKFTEEQLRDVAFTDDLFKKFIMRFNYRFKIKLKYIAVREFHKSGRIHYHMICDWKKELIFEDEIRENESFLGEKVWKHGFVDIKQLNHVDNVGAYIIKYMTKNVAIEFFRGKKVYLCSKGLERPFVYRGAEAQTIIDYYDLGTKKEVFTNSYESEYLGNITYTEYNLRRI
jgi:hypothetical protein